jgi:hypothetical protein
VPAHTAEQMQRHVRVVAWLFLGFGGFWISLAVWFLSAGGVWEWDPLAFAFIFWFVLAAIPLLLVGWGLLRRRSWARLVGLVLAAIGLMIVPIGTAFGAYAFWVLLAEGTRTLFSHDTRLLS